MGKLSRSVLRGGASCETQTLPDSRGLRYREELKFLPWRACQLQALELKS